MAKKMKKLSILFMVLCGHYLASAQIDASRFICYNDGIQIPNDSVRFNIDIYNNKVSLCIQYENSLLLYDGHTEDFVDNDSIVVKLNSQAADKDITIYFNQATVMKVHIIYHHKDASAKQYHRLLFHKKKDYDTLHHLYILEN